MVDKSIIIIIVIIVSIISSIIAVILGAVIMQKEECQLKCENGILNKEACTCTCESDWKGIKCDEEDIKTVEIVISGDGTGPKKVESFTNYFASGFFGKNSFRESFEEAIASRSADQPLTEKEKRYPEQLMLKPKESNKNKVVESFNYILDVLGKAGTFNDKIPDDPDLYNRYQISSKTNLNKYLSDLKYWIKNMTQEQSEQIIDKFLAKGSPTNFDPKTSKFIMKARKSTMDKHTDDNGVEITSTSSGSPAKEVIGISGENMILDKKYFILPLPLYLIIIGLLNKKHGITAIFTVSDDWVPLSIGAMEKIKRNNRS